MLQEANPKLPTDLDEKAEVLSAVASSKERPDDVASMVMKEAPADLDQTSFEADLDGSSELSLHPRGSNIHSGNTDKAETSNEDGDEVDEHNMQLPKTNPDKQDADATHEGLSPPVTIRLSFSIEPKASSKGNTLRPDEAESADTEAESRMQGLEIQSNPATHDSDLPGDHGGEVTQGGLKGAMGGGEGLTSGIPILLASGEGLRQPRQPAMPDMGLAPEGNALAPKMLLPAPAEGHYSDRAFEVHPDELPVKEGCVVQEEDTAEATKAELSEERLIMHDAAIQEQDAPSMAGSEDAGRTLSTEVIVATESKSDPAADGVTNAPGFHEAPHLERGDEEHPFDRNNSPDASAEPEGNDVSGGDPAILEAEGLTEELAHLTTDSSSAGLGLEANADSVSPVEEVDFIAAPKGAEYQALQVLKPDTVTDEAIGLQVQGATVEVVKVQVLEAPETSDIPMQIHIQSVAHQRPDIEPGSSGPQQAMSSINETEQDLQEAADLTNILLDKEEMTSGAEGNEELMPEEMSEAEDAPEDLTSSQKRVTFQLPSKLYTPFHCVCTPHHAFIMSQFKIWECDLKLSC